MVGRTDDLRRLVALLSDQRGVSVVLAGAAGVGKTRLGTECLERAEAAGMAVERVTATQGAASVPLGAFATLLPATDHEAGAVDDRADLLRRCAAALVDRAEGRRLALLVGNTALLAANLINVRRFGVAKLTALGREAPTLENTLPYGVAISTATGLYAAAHCAGWV